MDLGFQHTRRQNFYAFTKTQDLALQFKIDHHFYPDDNSLLVFLNQLLRMMNGFGQYIRRIVFINKQYYLVGLVALVFGNSNQVIEIFVEINSTFFIKWLLGKLLKFYDAVECHG